MIEILLFLFIGIAAGTAFGLVPGLHPNTLVLATPLLAALALEPLALLAFVVGMAVANSIVDFIPSIILGAPDSDSALATLPGHQMLMEGHGYQAIKLAVTGGIAAIIFTIILLPVLVISVPSVFAVLRPYTHILLIFVASFLVMTEPGIRKLLSLVFFFAAGAVGLMISMLPVDSSVALFPILAGLFGVSALLLQIRTRSRIPKQKKSEYYVSKKIIGRSSLLGTLGGIVAGLLPGIGSSSIAALASVEKDRESFLTSLGAITTANILLSIMSLWLISRPRSGAAVIIDQLLPIGFREFIFIVVFALVAVGVAAVATLQMSKIFLRKADRIDYKKLSYAVIVFLAAAAFLFSGVIGLLLLAVCTSLGIAAQLSGVRRGILMGVLILPTIIFFSPL